MRKSDVLRWQTAVLAAWIAAAGCSRGEQATVLAVAPVDSVVAPPTVMPDTFAAPEPEPEPEPAVEDIHSVNEAIVFMNKSADSAAYAAGVMPLIARENVKWAKKLMASEHKHFIVADKGTLYVYLYDRYGREIKRYHMCAAKNRGTKHEKGDSRTPEGFFTVEGIYDSTDWLFTDDNGVTSKEKGQFGPRFIRLRTPVSMQIGIHGTCAPWSLGSRSSHGCMRVANESILELVEYVEPGMMVIVNPGRKDEQVNIEEGHDVFRLKFYLGKDKLPPALPEPVETAPDSTATEAAADSVQRPDSIPAPALPVDTPAVLVSEPAARI